MLVYNINDKLKRNASSTSPSCSVLSNKTNTVRKVRSALKKHSSVKCKLLSRRMNSPSRDQENNNSENIIENKRKVQFAPMAKVVLVRKIHKEEGKNIWYNHMDYKSFEHERRRAVAFFQDAIENKRLIDPKQHTVAGLEKYLNVRLKSGSIRSRQSKQHQSRSVPSDSKPEVDTKESIVQEKSEAQSYHFEQKGFAQPEQQPYYYNYGYNYWYNPPYDYGHYTINPGYYMPKSHYSPEQYYKQYEQYAPYIPVVENKSLCMTPAC